MDSRDLQAWCKERNLSVRLTNPLVAVLKGYKLIFTPFSANRKEGAADIVKEEGSRVHGVLFETDEESLKNLDKKEIPYRRVTIEVVVGKKVFDSVVVYEIIEKGECLPNKQYLGIMIGGAKEHNLPKKYIKELEAMPTAD